MSNQTEKQPTNINDENNKEVSVVNNDVKQDNKKDENRNDKEKKTNDKNSVKKQRRSFLGGARNKTNVSNKENKKSLASGGLSVTETLEKPVNRDLDKEEIAKRIAESGRKTVVRSYRSFEVVFLKIIKFISSRLDATIKSPRNSKILSLLLAVLLSVAISGEMLPKIFVSQHSGEVVDGVSVHVNYSSQKYEIEGIPDTVSVSFVGDRFNLQTTLSQQIYRVYADLTKYGVGTHNVNLEVTNVSGNVKATVNPSTVTVTIREKASYRKTFDYEFVNRDKIDTKFILSTPTFDRNDILLMVSEERIQQIASIKAQIDVQGIDSEGTYSLVTVVKAFDSSGKEISASFVPETVTATIEVTAPSKIVPITVVPIGELMDSTKAISEITLTHDSATIYGPEAELNKISELKVEVDISTISGTSQKYTVPIIYPNGVTKADTGNAGNVGLLITLVEKTSRVFNNIPVRYINNNSNLKPTAVGAGVVDVRVYGAAKRLDALLESNISVVIDLGHIETVGEYDVVLDVVLSDLTLSSELIGSDVIQITMSN